MIRASTACIAATALLLTVAVIPRAGAGVATGPVTEADCAMQNARTNPMSAQAPRFDPTTLGGFATNLRRAIADPRDSNAQNAFWTGDEVIFCYEDAIASMDHALDEVRTQRALLADRIAGKETAVLVER